MKFQIRREQQLNCDINTAWAFFSSPNNLSKITPDDIKFIVKDNLKEEIFVGMKINYTIAPLLGIPLKWQTLITAVNHNKSFIDVQAKGPFKLWHHKHEFYENDAGVLMIDTVDYELPFGILGVWTHRIAVRKKLNHIFNFRYKILKQRFK